MKVFHCDHCDHLLFFENVQCVNCENVVAYLPDLGVVGSLSPTVARELWQSPLPRSEGRTYRLCSNYTEQNVCNWAIPSDDPNSLCLSCRLTRVIPHLDQANHKVLWYRLEVAKRRLLYTLLGLGLPIHNREEDPLRGLAFEFLADPEPDPETGQVNSILTGHANGVITINIAEADDAERERRKAHLHEPYRTLLGHVRHEIGHYFWDRLIRDSSRLEPFRVLFGDDRQDYAQALQRHYDQGPPENWQGNHVTAYAAAHPWEDWAETWAHYLHLTDTLETAADSGLSLRPRRRAEPVLPVVPDPLTRVRPFEQLIDSWYPLTYVLNNLNRGLGLPDGYPFVLSPVVVEKLRFVHDTVTAVV